MVIVSEKAQRARDLDTITDFEWRELRLRFGDIVLETPEICLTLVEVVRRDRIH